MECNPTEGVYPLFLCTVEGLLMGWFHVVHCRKPWRHPCCCLETSPAEFRDRYKIDMRRKNELTAGLDDHRIYVPAQVISVAIIMFLVYRDGGSRFVVRLTRSGPIHFT